MHERCKSIASFSLQLACWSYGLKMSLLHDPCDSAFLIRINVAVFCESHSTPRWSIVSDVLKNINAMPHTRPQSCKMSGKSWQPLARCCFMPFPQTQQVWSSQLCWLHKPQQRGMPGLRRNGSATEKHSVQEGEVHEMQRRSKAWTRKMRW